MEFVDTHAHLDAFFDDNSLDEVLQRAENAHVKRIISCSARICDWENFSNLARIHKGKIFWQLGLHPSEIADFDLSVLDKMHDFLKCATPPISIGEIGLDFYKMEGSPDEIENVKTRQAEFFKRQLEVAKSANLPVCIHARNAVKEAVEIIDASGIDWHKVVFHCFSGTVDEIKQINARGGRASFTGIITFKNADQMRDVMMCQGLSKIMFETDCPYLAPAPNRGKKNEPSYIPLIAQKAAELFGISIEEIAKISTKNVEEFFNL